MALTIFRNVFGNKQVKTPKSRLLNMDEHYETAMISYAHMAYHSPLKIVDRLEASGAVRVCVYNYERMQAFLAEFDDYAVVSFRGIEEPEEFKTILRFWKKEYNGHRVHAGFVDSINNISKSLIKDLEELDRNKTLIYTGHSMGGALALLLTMHFKPTRICTFGSPKVGGGEEYLEQFKDIEVLRIVGKYDFVSYLPPSLPFISPYEHVGRTIKVGNEKHPYKAHRLSTYMAAIVSYYKRNIRGKNG